MDGTDNLTGDGISGGDWLDSVVNGVDGDKDSNIGNNLDSLSFFVVRRVFFMDSLTGVRFLAFSDESEVGVEAKGGVDNVSLVAVRSCCDGSGCSLALQWARWPFSLLNVLPQYGHTPVHNTTNNRIIVVLVQILK